MVSLADKIVERHLREARGPMPSITTPATISHGKKIRKVLTDLDKANIFMDFDLLSGLFQQASRMLGDEDAQTAKILARQFSGIRDYLRSFASSALGDAGELASRMEGLS